MKIPFAIAPKRPEMVWLRCCGLCPTNNGPHDPESIDLASEPIRTKRMRNVFACAWRPEGYCAANYKLMHDGLNMPMLTRSS
jgi:hypothetical protein